MSGSQTQEHPEVHSRNNGLRFGFFLQMESVDKYMLCTCLSQAASPSPAAHGEVKQTTFEIATHEFGSIRRDANIHTGQKALGCLNWSAGLNYKLHLIMAHQIAWLIGPECVP